MKQVLSFLLYFCIVIISNGQEIPPEYYKLINKADSLFVQNQYKKAALTYSEAMKANNGRMLLNDRYNVACTWALANYPDSAFYHLDIMVTKTNFSYYSSIAKDFDLLSLHADARWKPLLEKVKQNQVETDKKWKINCSSVIDEDIAEIVPAQIESYQLNLYIDVESKAIKVDGYVNVNFHNNDSINLVLWGKTDIEEINCNGQNVKYYFDTLSKSPIIYIPDGRKLTVEKVRDTSKKQKLYFKYTCDMSDVNDWGRSFENEWIEIGYYTAWYPVNKNSENFTASSVRIHIDPRYKVSGSGLVERKDNVWKMTQNWEAYDIVIIASENLKSKKLQVGNTTIETVYTTFPQSDIDSVLAEFKYVLDFYTELFGPTGEGDSYSKLVLNPLEGGGGYSRKNYISLKSHKFDGSLGCGIAHEMAHFWWNKANSTTWHDWINEAFAEYGMLLYVKEKWGDRLFESYIEAYKVNSSNSCPIWGIDRAKPEAYTALYEKGSLILNDLQQITGYERFFEFVRCILDNHIKTTTDFLNLTQLQLGENMRDWLESKLKMSNW
ncbi:MAG: hypothetical protein LBL90_11070 [Prevotellaceae bacterium]|jgi:hypothetical protein|nr:hypothetical protein [Prevotellaceae bacterium]